MQQHTQNPTGAFNILPEQTRQISCNHSIISSLYNHASSYRELQDYFSSLPSDIIDMPALHQADFIKLKKYKEAVYYGEYRQEKRDGKGIMLYQSGQRYDGEWRGDQRQGHGKEIFANGSIYEGTYFQNKIHGQGKYTWPAGQTYEGEWQNNLKDGSGMWVNSQGDSYIGEWVEGAATGFGVFTEVKASRYEGTFTDFVKNGKGTQKFATGDLYQGRYTDGKFDGFGEYYWKNKSFYKGEFKAGLKHGYGMWHKGDSSQKYEGQFQENRKEGYGIYTWNNGNVYKGHYHANLRHGTGEMFWNDGTFYKGAWLVDKPNGKGALFDGLQLTKGFFKDGQMLEVEQPEEERREISQFYLDGNPTKRVVATPIRKVSEEATQRYPKSRLNLSQVEKDAKVREIRPNEHPKKTHERDKSFVRRKLMQTITFDQKGRQRRETTDNRSNGSKSQSREKVLHSAFQIHRLYKTNKKPGPSEHPSQATADSQGRFAFEGGSTGQVPRGRYFSKFD